MEMRKGKLCVLVLALVAGLPVQAGELGKVKRDVAQRESREYDDRQDGGSGSGIFNSVLKALFQGAVSSASFSMARVSGNYDVEELERGDYQWWHYDLRPRRLGEASLPFLQAELSLHNPVGDTFDVNYSALVGYGAFAYKIKQHNYSETHPNDELDIEQRHFLIRLSLTNDLELHQGFGTTRFKDASGFNEEEGSYTSPVIYSINPEYQLEFTPVWSASTTEYDLSVNRTWDYYSFKLGYRQFSSDSVELGGLFLSVSAFF